MWQLRPLCLFWVIWKARNTIAFEDGVLSIQKLKVSFCVFILVGNQTVDKRWSFDLNRFYRLGMFAIREKVFLFFLLFGSFCNGVSLSIL